MRRAPWTAPVAIALAGLAAAAAIAFAGGMRMVDVGHLLLYSVAGVTVTGVLAALLLRACRRRGIVTQAAVVALTPILAVGVAAGWAASAMFLAGHDVVVLCVVLVSAGTLALIVALVLGRRVAGASDDLAGLARWLGEPDASLPRNASPGGPGELAALARELELTSARLREARARADQTERTRRELVAWVSHDLRTPLAGIRVMSEALADGVVEDPETVSRYLRTIRLQTDRLAGLVDDLFDLARIQAGALVLETERVPLDELICEVVEASRPTAGSVELVVRAAGAAPHVDVAASAIVRVLRNLIDNALRHTPAGGVVVVEAGGEGADAWISVCDRCGGIPEADLGRVFEPGWRGDAARTPGEGRSGLGLAVAEGLVAAHGGRIEVQNTEVGCRFTVRLAAAPPAKIAAAGVHGEREGAGALR